MNRTKRILAFLLALILALALTACGDADLGWHVDAPDNQPPASTQGTAPAETRRPSAPVETQSPAATQKPSAPPETETPAPTLTVSEDGRYDSKEEVALYLHLYGHLPGNYITTAEAEALGWTGGSVEKYAGEGAAIGGSRFGNYEGQLPDAKGRTWRECDIDTVGTSSRGAKRLVYSNDGLIYYTEDHYESFVLLYGEP